MWGNVMLSQKEKNIVSIDLPEGIIVVNDEGRILAANEAISNIYKDEVLIENNIKALTGKKLEDILSEIESGGVVIAQKKNDSFKLIVSKDEEKSGNYIVIFKDVTYYQDLKDRYNREKICVMKIQIDNSDELLDNSSAPKLKLRTEIDNLIRSFAEKINGSLTRISISKYLVLFEQEKLDGIMEKKFSILDDARSLESEQDFPVSLSIGVGAGGKNLKQTEEFADSAMDLALGRGGDQAVVKRSQKTEYFGGKLQSVEKSNKGKSRIVGHALKALVNQSKYIFVMGHKNPDMDSLGSCLGIMRLCMLWGKEPYLVIDEYDDILETAFTQVKESGEYKIMSSKTAISMADKDGLVIILDVHRPMLVACTELLDICEKKVVIDHHRKMEDFIENPTLQYMESYASSASELVSEILQYMTSKKVLQKLEAEMLLGGIMIDTNNFAVKSGVRTFEAAAWLRRQGADPTEVKRFFQEDEKIIKLKYEALSRVEIYNGIAITTCEIVRADAQVICAQIADMILGIKGVMASFVVGRNKSMKTVVSARSLGEINVQIVMEQFGGGGHLTTAAAQVDNSIDETVKMIKDYMEV